MARKTTLKMLSQRPAPVDLTGNPDERTVIEAFPRQIPDPASTDDPLGADILAVLRSSHERLEERAGQAAAVASAALNRVDEVAAGTVTLTERTDAVEQKIQRVGESIIALADQQETRRATARAASIGLLHRLGERVTSVAAFAVDRAPALLALGSAVWLWRGVLDNPQWIQLAALGLYGACVIAPAVWLGARKS